MQISVGIFKIKTDHFRLLLLGHVSHSPDRELYVNGTKIKTEKFPRPKPMFKLQHDFQI